MRLPLLTLLLAATALAACDSATEGPAEAALIARRDGEVSREGPPVPLPEALALTDFVRIPTVPERSNTIVSSYRVLNLDGLFVSRTAQVFLAEERRDGSLRLVSDGALPPDPDRTGLFVFAPTAFLDGRTEAMVYFRGMASADSLVLRAGAGLLGPDRAAPLTIDPLTPTQSLGALVRSVDRAAPRITPVLLARYRPGTGCVPRATVSPLVRNPRREPLYATPADTTALGPCRGAGEPVQIAPVEALLVLMPR